MANTNTFTRQKLQRGSVGRSNLKYMQCVAYWKEYLDACAPRPNATTRLFPSVLALKHQYKLNFLGRYADSQGWKGRTIPSYETWRRARLDPLFADVKRQKNHYHGKCTTCSALTKQMSAQFGTSNLEQIRALWLAHKKDLDDFKQLETYWTQRAMHSPHEVVVLMFDDTESIGFPHFGQRTPKSWGDRRRDLKVSQSWCLCCYFRFVYSLVVSTVVDWCL